MYRNVFRFNTSGPVNKQSVGTLGGAATGGSLQLGPNGKIYGTSLTHSHLAVIDDPNAASVGDVGFKANGVPLESGSTAALGLPPFVASYVNNVALIDDDAYCSDTVNMYVKPIDAGDDIDVCPNQNPFNLNAIPSGGQWSGNQITNSVLAF